jgi:hypothetical protein
MTREFRTDRIDLFEIEQEARRMRAEMTRAGLARVRAWLGGRSAAGRTNG